MSKLLAMMMKPKNYMYATIKGSLTENPSGVFSGFSDSNYLDLQQPFKVNQDTIAEIEVKVNLSFLDTYISNVIIGYPNSYNIQINCIGEQPKLHLFIGNGNSWNLLNNIIGITTISVNTDYFIKLVFNKNNVKLLLSTDKINWTTEINQNITLTEEYIYNLCIGKGRSSNQYLYGSIDLNETYIKINNTKYQLQAVVGYTVVGSPTIVDGVVSGFSGSDYIKLNNIPDFSNKDFEIQICATANVVKNERIFSNNAVASSITGVRCVGTNGVIAGDFYDGNTKYTVESSSNPLVVGNKTYIKFLRKKTMLIMQTSYDKINWSSNTIQIPAESSFSMSGTLFAFTAVSQGIVFDGSIDFKETYIKVNNKLWFNGQEG